MLQTHAYGDVQRTSVWCFTLLVYVLDPDEGPSQESSVSSLLRSSPHDTQVIPSPHRRVLIGNVYRRRRSYLLGTNKRYTSSVAIPVIQNLASIQGLERPVVRPLEIGKDSKVRWVDADGVLEDDPSNSLSAGWCRNRAGILQTHEITAESLTEHLKTVDGW